MKILIIILIILFYCIYKKKNRNIEKFEDVCIFDKVKCEKILNKSVIEKNLDDLRLLYDIIMEQDRTTDNIKIILNNHHNVILNLLENRYKILEKYHFSSLFKIIEVTDENKDDIIENLIDIVETEIEDLEDMLQEIEDNPDKYQNLIIEKKDLSILESENENLEEENENIGETSESEDEIPFFNL